MVLTGASTKEERSDCSAVTVPWPAWWLRSVCPMNFAGRPAEGSDITVSQEVDLTFNMTDRPVRAVAGKDK